MTDGVDQLIANIVVGPTGLLAADVGLTYFDGQVPTDPTTGKSSLPPYVVVYTTIGRPSGDRDNSLDGRSRVIIARWYCHCVGGSMKTARAVAQRVRTQLLDARPVVGGLSCGLIREIPNPPEPLRDETTGDTVIDALQIYEMRAAV